jgi:hypothetical protein
MHSPLKIGNPIDRNALMSLIFLYDHLYDFKDTLDIVTYPRLIAQSIIEISGYLNKPEVNSDVKGALSEAIRSITEKLAKID